MCDFVKNFFERAKEWAQEYRVELAFIVIVLYGLYGLFAIIG